MARVLLCDYPNPDGRARLRALRELGHEVLFFNSQAPTLDAPAAEPLKVAARTLIPFSGKLSAFLNTRVTSARLLAECEKFRPDIVLIIKGANLRAAILRRIKRRLKPLLINWFGDSLLTPGIRPLVEQDSGVYDFFFIIDDKRALDLVRVRAAHVSTLPFACDPVFHRPAPLTDAERSLYGSPVVFVGTVIPSREPALLAVAEFGLKIWGPSRNPLGTRDLGRSPLAPRWHGRSAYGEEAVKIYTASDIILDVHFLFGGEQPISNVTARVFEVPACGGFLLTNACDQLERLYAVGREMICYRSLEELRRLTGYYLSHAEERRAIAAHAQARARSEHTFKRRLEEMFDLVTRTA